LEFTRHGRQRLRDRGPHGNGAVTRLTPGEDLHWRYDATALVDMHR
jgi:hypothetical protein